MNTVVRNMKERRSIRAYKPELIAENELDEILEAGIWAPTGMNRQAVKLVAVTNKETVKKISKLNAAVMGTDTDPFYGAPEVVIVFADSSVFTYVEDGALAMGNMLNAAHSLGVASCWIHRAREVFDTVEGRALATEWGIPENYKGIGNCILGYAAAPVQDRPRRQGRVIKVR